MALLRTHVAVTVLGALACLAPRSAFAQAAGLMVPEAKSDEAFDDRYVLDTGRFVPPAPHPDYVSVGLHGEYQLRFRAMTDLPLEPPVSDPSARRLGQTNYVYHWLRLKPRADLSDEVSVVGEIDLPRGLVGGQTTAWVERALVPLDEPDWYMIEPRQLYVEVRSEIGLFRVGHQTAHWGMGLIANDGDHQTLFGDYIRGDIVERFLFATKPLGRESPLFVAIAGDIVFRDDTADLIDRGDLAFQGVTAVAYRTQPAELGVYGALRHQRSERRSTGPLTPYDESLTAFVLDVAGRFNAPMPGQRAFAYGAFEAATIFGSTDIIRTAWYEPTEPTAPRAREAIASFGAAAKLGFVHLTGPEEGEPHPNGGVPREGPYGDFVGELEWGWASGDADPADGTTRRFTMDPNHNVGLVLFDHVLAWQTARAATILSDPRLVGRAPPGIDLFPSNGGVFSATYLNPRAIFRPRRFLDIKAGVVIAQSTADVVDPYQFGARGNVANYRGGGAQSRDLGLELDLGFDVRVPASRTTTLQLGAEGGVLFPGGAFDDAVGQRMPPQSLLNTRLGLQF